MLSEKYNEIFVETVKDFSNNTISAIGNDLFDKEYTLFYPSIGKDYFESRELLVYGQATNKWCPRFKVSAVKDSYTLAQESIKYSGEESGICPLDWVNKYWITYKLWHSFFWNVTYKLVKERYHRSDKNWNNIIAWSNLMKIAPAEGGNPNHFEIEAQIKNASKLFTQELGELKPKNVLIITNLNVWAKPILEHSGIEIKAVQGEYIQAVCQYNGCNIIVTKRPYIGGKYKLFINEILNYFVDAR